MTPTSGSSPRRPSCRLRDIRCSGRRLWSGAAQQAALVRLKTEAGVIPIALSRERDEIVYGEMEQPIPEFAPFDRADEVLTAVGGGAVRAARDVVPQRAGARIRGARQRGRGRGARAGSQRPGQAGRGGRELLCRLRRALQDPHVRSGRGRGRGPGHRLGGGSARRPPRAPRLESSTAGRSRSARERRSAGPR